MTVRPSKIVVSETHNRLQELVLLFVGFSGATRLKVDAWLESRILCFVILVLESI